MSLSPAIGMYDAFGWMNHHALTVAIGTAALAASISAVRLGGTRRAVLAAAMAILAAWESMETVHAVVAAWSVIMLAAAACPGRDRTVRVYAAALACLSPIPLLVDPDPDGVLSMATDRYGAFHLAAFLALAICAALAPLVRGNGRLRVRLARVCAICLPPFIALGYAAAQTIPSIFTDPATVSYFTSWNTDLMPAWANTAALAGATLPTVPALILLIIVAVPGLKGPSWPAWLLAICVFGCEFVLGVLHQRLSTYPAMLSALVLGVWMQRCVSRANPALAKPALLACAFMLGALSWPSARLVRTWATMDVVPGEGACNIGSANSSAIVAAVPPGSIVAADIWSSSELLARTGLRTVAGPYHRNFDGIKDLAVMLGGTDERAARAAAMRRGVGALLVCDAPEYAMRSAFPDESLERRLHDRRVPSWLVQIALPAGSLKLYKVVR